MSNLIVTVISIALVAVAALMGAYYGGGAFIDGQAKSQANAIIEGAKQVAAAWTMYAVDHGGSYVMTDTSWSDGTANDLVPKYLAQFPKYSFANVNYPSYGYYFRILDMGIAWDSTAGNVIGLGGISQKVCEQVNLTAKGIANAFLYNWGDQISKLTPFACFDYPLGAGGDIFYLLYRVY